MSFGCYFVITKRVAKSDFHILLLINEQKRLVTVATFELIMAPIRSPYNTTQHKVLIGENINKLKLGFGKFDECQMVQSSNLCAFVCACLALYFTAT